MTEKKHSKKRRQIKSSRRCIGPVFRAFTILPFVVSYLLVVVFLSSCNVSQTATLKEQLDAVITPLNGSSPTLDNSDLQVLAHLGNAQIVGLGEASHGTREFFQMKHRIFKYLVEEHGFRVFAFEADFAESLYFEDYITTGEGDLDQLMREKMIFWVWRTEEVRDLLEWMKNYNIGKSPDQMVHYVGVDCHFPNHYPEKITQYLGRIAPDLLVEAAPWLEAPTTTDRSHFQYLMDRLDARAATGDFAGNEKEYRITKQLLRVLWQMQDLVNNQDGFAARDRYMAENTLWIREHFGADTKIAAWAHNGHVSKKGYGGIKSQGTYLRETLGENYQVIGFGFSTGTVSAKSTLDSGLGPRVIDIIPEEGSYNKVFQEAKYENFIFDFSRVTAGSKLEEWLNSMHQFFSLGSSLMRPVSRNYADFRLAEEFDILIYFDVANASRILKK